MANSTHPGAGLRVPGKGRVTERVVDEICRYIESKGLNPGDKLPPERVFVELFGVGRSSLREALRVLSATGLIEVVHGGGMYVSSTPQAAMSGSNTSTRAKRTRCATSSKPAWESSSPPSRP